MAVFVALLRAVNVGGVTLAMKDLTALCSKAGFANVRTYIASGNAVFTSALPEIEIKTLLEAQLAAHAGRPVGVLVRTGAELAAVLERNPFPDRRPDRTVAIFLDEAPPADMLAGITGRKDEEIALGTREIYVHYGEGMGRSKLKIRAARSGTARNMNTVAKLAAMTTDDGS